MSDVVIFLVGLPITLVVFLAMGILAYAIRLESIELAGGKTESESLTARDQAAEASQGTSPPAQAKLPLAPDPRDVPSAA
jgi:hypothetical protein